MAIIDLRTAVSVVAPAAGDLIQCGTAQFRVRVQNASSNSTLDGDASRVYALLNTTPAGALNVTSYTVASVTPGVVTATPVGTAVTGPLNGAVITTFPAGGEVEYLVDATVPCGAPVATVTTTAWVIPGTGDSLPSSNQSVSSVLFTLNARRVYVEGTKTLCGGGTLLRIGHRERWNITITNTGTTDALAGGMFSDVLPEGVNLVRWRYTAPDGAVVSGTTFPAYAPAIPAGETLTMVVEGDVTQCVCPGPVQNCFTYCLAPASGQVANSTTRCLNICWDGAAQRVQPEPCVSLTDCVKELCCNTPGSIKGQATIRLVTPDGKPAIDPRTGEAFSCGITYGPYEYDAVGCVSTCPLPMNTELLTSATVNRNGSLVSSACTGILSWYEMTVTTMTYDEFGRQIGSCNEGTMKFTLRGGDPRLVGGQVPVRSIAEGSAWAEYLEKCLVNDLVCD